MNNSEQVYVPARDTVAGDATDKSSTSKSRHTYKISDNGINELAVPYLLLIERSQNDGLVQFVSKCMSTHACTVMTRKTLPVIISSFSSKQSFDLTFKIHTFCICSDMVLTFSASITSKSHVTPAFKHLAPQKKFQKCAKQNRSSTFFVRPPLFASLVVKIFGKSAMRAQMN